MVYVYVLVMMLYSSVALADEPPVSAINWMDVLFMIVNQVLPIMLSFFSGYVTKGVLWLMSAVGGKWSPVVSSIIGTVVSGVGAAMLGQSPDTISVSAGLGGASGLAGHALLQSKPLATVPKEQSSGALNGEHL